MQACEIGDALSWSQQAFSENFCVPGPFVGARIQCEQVSRGPYPQGELRLSDRPSSHSWSPTHQLVIWLLPWFHVVFMIVHTGGWSIIHYSVFLFPHLQYQYEKKGPEIPPFLLLFIIDRSKDQMKWFMWKNILCSGVFKCKIWVFGDLVLLP